MLLWRKELQGRARNEIIVPVIGIVLVMQCIQTHTWEGDGVPEKNTEEENDAVGRGREATANEVLVLREQVKARAKAEDL